MITFAMLILTLFTVLGGVILGWLARRYVLGGEWCGPLDTHSMPTDSTDQSGLVAGAIGTVAAGTAAVNFANSESTTARSSLSDSGNASENTDQNTSGGQVGGSSGAGSSDTAPMIATKSSSAAAWFDEGNSSSAGSAGTAAHFASVEGVSPTSDNTGSGSSSSGVAASSSGLQASRTATSSVATASGATAAAVAAAETSSTAAWFDEGNSSGAASVSTATHSAPSGDVASTSDNAGTDGSSSGANESGSGPQAGGTVSATSASTSEAAPSARSDGTSSSGGGSSTSDNLGSDRSSSGAPASGSGSQVTGTSSSTSKDAVEKAYDKSAVSSTDGEVNEEGASSSSDATSNRASSDATSTDGQQLNTRASDSGEAAISDTTTGTATNFMSDAAASSSATTENVGASDSTTHSSSTKATVGDAPSPNADSKQADISSGAATRASLASGANVVTSADTQGANASTDADSATRSTKANLGDASSVTTGESGSTSDTGTADAKASRGTTSQDEANAFSSTSSVASAAGVGGAAIAGAAITSQTGSAKEETTSAELEASRAEVRGLRKRLSQNESDSADHSGKSVVEQLAASREEARALRQELWSKEQAAEKAATSTSKGDAAVNDDTNFGDLSAEETEAERLLASGEIPKKPSNALDTPTPGFDAEDLTEIRGIGKPTQARLNRHGIYYYDQIAGFTAPDIAWADKTLNLEGRVVSDRWIPQAKLLAGDLDDEGGADTAASDDGGTTDAASFVDIPSELSAEEAEAERLLASGEDIAPPASRLDAPRSGVSPDDLTKIKGIGPKINGKLNDQGIYYYDQIAGFSGSDLAWADRELDFKGRAVRDRWVPQAQGLMDAQSAASADNSKPTVAAPAGLLSKPIDGRAPDDLTAIKGVGNVMQKQLNDKGIYYYSQIAEFSESDQEWANQTLGFAGRVERDNWIPQARELMTKPSPGGRAARVEVLADASRALDSTSDDGEFGKVSAGEAEAMRLIESGEFVADESNRPASLLSSASEGPKDDLQQIKGVGPKLEDLLNNLGVYYFRQIGGFSPTDIAWVDSKLKFKGRIVRDRWVDQAKRLT